MPAREGSEYDRLCAREFALVQAKMDRFFVELNTACPYGLPFMACFYQAMFGPLTDRAMELFLAAGYRRNGNCLYTMRCRECQACIPIRIKVRQFQPSRSQRRVLTKNSDLHMAYQQVDMDTDHLALCERFLKARYPQENNTAEGYYGGFFCNSIVQSMRLSFTCGEQLLAGSIIDLGENWLNAVYFYFDPAESWRSLGTYNILTLVDLCLDLDIDYLYLGYYIEGVSAMSYKNRFHPHELLIADRWRSGG